jgi:hypothetical protein
MQAMMTASEVARIKRELGMILLELLFTRTSPEHGGQ